MTTSPPVSIAAAVSREIAGERVLWAGSPEPWAYAGRYWKTAVLGIPFTAFAIFWMYGASHIPAKADHEAAVFFPLWGLMFIGIGLAMLASPLWARWSARNVYYVVTERRALIFEKPFRIRIRAFPRSAVNGYERVSSGGASGSIILQRIVSQGSRGHSVREIGFICLPDYAGAEQALDKLIAGSSRV